MLLFSFSFLGNLSIGAYTVTYVASDASGNRNNCSFSITVSRAVARDDPSLSASASSQDASTAIAGGAGAGAVLLIAFLALFLVLRMKRNAKQVCFFVLHLLCVHGYMP